MALLASSIERTPCIVWFTGLPCAGKTTIARLVKQLLLRRGNRVFLIDGDVMRRGLCSDLGYSMVDRAENLRRAAEVAALLADQGFIVLAAFITPTQADRDFVRKRMAAYPFIEAFVDTDLSIAEARDVKGLYRRARSGEIPDFTGVSSPFEIPACPDLRLETVSWSADHLAKTVVDELAQRGVTRDCPPTRGAQ